eukprot:6196625-Pleurochrysis_carterae.AAC.4
MQSTERQAPDAKQAERRGLSIERQTPSSSERVAVPRKGRKHRNQHDRQRMASTASERTHGTDSVAGASSRQASAAHGEHRIRKD